MSESAAISDGRISNKCAELCQKLHKTLSVFTINPSNQDPHNHIIILFPSCRIGSSESLLLSVFVITALKLKL